MATVAPQLDLKAYALDLCKRAKEASQALNRTTGKQKQAWLRRSARVLRDRTPEIVEANARDLEAAPGYGLTDAAIDRLRLTPAGIEKIALALEEIALLADPIGEIIESSIRPNGLEVQKVRVPLGVVFFIYESRPNVTADAAALCVKSGNAVILRGGKEALHSNKAIADLLTETAVEEGLPADAMQLVGTADRDVVGHLLQRSDYISVTIPRGGEGLIRRVAAEARMPVIKHFAGNCHVYVDRAADLEMAERITINSKCQRMGVCNAAESLVVHVDVAARFLPRLGKALAERGVEIRGDRRVRAILPGAVEATEADLAAEYLGPILSAVVVDSLEDAVRHINRYSSGHTEAILTADLAAARQFTRDIDSSAVIVNASTRFNDGGEFGLGGEIGISTDKFHARGPCGLKELTSYKYLVYGEGQIRE